MVRRTRAGSAGFSLIELLLAVTLGALLLLATASSAGVFGEQLSELEGESDAELQAALASVADETRYAWTAEVPTARRLVLTDEQGRETTYSFANQALTVTRPDGTQGVLVDGVQSGSFSAETVTRYREATPVTRSASFWSQATPASTPAATILDAGDKLALGFTPASTAPVPGNTPGVTEQMTGASFDSVSLPLAAIAPLGAAATVQLSLYRARSPLDGRPEGAALASSTVQMTALPEATSYVWNTKSRKVVNPPKKATWGWWLTHADYTLVVSAPATTTSFDVSSFAAQIQPGNAYTLVLEPTVSGVALASYATASATQSGIALSKASGAYVAQALVLPRNLTGTVTMTRSTATDVVSRVLVSLTDLDGNQATGSAAVIGQNLADEPWLGVVPGERGP